MLRTYGPFARFMRCQGQHNSALCASRATTSQSRKKQQGSKVMIELAISKKQRRRPLVSVKQEAKSGKKGYPASSDGER